MKLIVGRDSTWSLRSCLCASLAGFMPELEIIDLSRGEASKQLHRLSPTGLVPVLKDGDIEVHDSLAIAEYLNEKSDGNLYPSDTAQRALARSLCAELHAGFPLLRSRCPFTLDAVTPVQPDVAMQRELTRIERIFSNANSHFYFAQPSVVDAFFAVMAVRLQHYGLELVGSAGEYQHQLLRWPALKEALKQARLWREAGA